MSIKMNKQYYKYKVRHYNVCTCKWGGKWQQKTFKKANYIAGVWLSSKTSLWMSASHIRNPELKSLLCFPFSFPLMHTLGGSRYFPRVGNLNRVMESWLWSHLALVAAGLGERISRWKSDSHSLSLTFTFSLSNKIINQSF